MYWVIVPSLIHSTASSTTNNGPTGTHYRRMAARQERKSLPRSRRRSFGPTRSALIRCQYRTHRQLGARLLLGDADVVGALQVEPELRRRAEPMAEARSR